MKFDFKSFIFFIILFYLIFLIRNDLLRYQSLKNEHSELKGSLTREEALKKELEKEFSSLKQNSYIEELAREKLGLIKKGEVLYKIVE